MEKLKAFLEGRSSKGLLRTLPRLDFREDGIIMIEGRSYYDFSSNDYLGLSTHPLLKEEAKKAIDKFGIGSSASRLLSGSLKPHHMLEEKVAHFKGKDEALVFNSGYQANVGIISAICNKADVIFYDRLSHASLIDGVVLSGARHFRFRHNDVNHLGELLRKERKKHMVSLIIVESVYSMDGDIAPLVEIVELKERYDSILMVDESHATGIFGESGAGIVEELGLSDRVELIMGTFSKALGSFGAYLACNRTIKDYLVNVCRSFIYSTSLPVSIIAANLAALELIKDAPERRRGLLENADYFRSQLVSRGFNVKGESQIVPLILGDSNYAKLLSAKLRSNGFWVFPIRYPTVPLKEARIRFSITYFHKKDILDRLIIILCQNIQNLDLSIEAIKETSS